MAEPKTLVKLFSELQQERVETYKLFEEGFQAYLAGAPHYNFPMYRQLVHEITETFQRISKDVVDIQNQLQNDNQLTEIAKYIGKIQNDEKTKLELTAKIQLTKQNMVDHQDENLNEEMSDLKHKMNNLIERINELLEDIKYESEDLMR